MKLIVLTGLPTVEKAQLTHDAAQHYIAAGQRVTVLDNANVAASVADLDTRVLNLRGGCVCCSVAGKLYAAADDLTKTADVAIMAADNQTHVGNLAAVLDQLVSGTKAPIDVVTVALVDERTTCCFPYVAETLEMSTDATLHAPFSVAALLEAVEGVKT